MAEIERAMFSRPVSRFALAPHERLHDLMVVAARRALEHARMRPEQIDRLYGHGLVSRHVSPDDLFEVHHTLQLRADAGVVPIANDFASFVASVWLAREAVASGSAHAVLVVCGSRMAIHVDERDGYSRAIGDAAGAAVVGRGDGDVILDGAFHVDGGLTDAATISLGTAASPPRFRIAPARIDGVREYGVTQPIRLLAELMQRHAIQPDQLTLVAHQPSRVLMDTWRQELAPAQYLDTFDTIGNATLASIPFTLATSRSAIRTPFIGLVSPGLGMHSTAVLLHAATTTTP